MERSALIVTSISAPNSVLSSLAIGSFESGIDFIVIGDQNSPSDFTLDNCRYFDVNQQLRTGFAYANVCHTKSYARKNIGYLIALRDGANVIIETDDDNYPRESFWHKRERNRIVRTQDTPRWTNVYRYFTDLRIWPRGFPLELIRNDPPALRELPVMSDCPIQQGLADENPDVDAIFRLAFDLPVSFRQDEPVALRRGSWCPFNSQNTTWWKDAAALLYLPTFCSFRMTDIWRSFVAQRIAWECDWEICFHSATVWQDRNEHNLVRDFADEIAGYLHNSSIASLLQNLALERGISNIPSNMRSCYRALVEAGFVGEGELELLSAWLSDISLLVDA